MTHVCDFLDDATWRSDDALLIWEGGSRRLGEFRRRVFALASALRGRRDRPVGSRVAFAGVTSPALLEAMLASAWNGWILVPLNLRWSQAEMRAAIALVQPSYLFLDPQTSHHLHPNCTTIRLGGLDSGPLSTDALIAEDAPPAARRKATEDWAVICFTSGSTGAPKGVVLSHQAICFQCLYKRAICAYAQSDVYLHLVPPFHVGGFISALAMLMAGAKHVLTERFSPEQAANLIQRHAVSCLVIVPAMITDLETQSQSFPSVQKILIGGGTPNHTQTSCIGRLFPNALVITAYGMTEAASSLTYADPIPAAQLQRRPAHVAGSPIPGTALRLDPETWEIQAKGPHLLSHYWTDPVATAAAFTADGWFRTGDVGRFDAAGQLRLLGRLKGTIKTGGENVYPAEVEAVLAQHPAVRDAVVVGIPHPRLGETVVACVVVQPQTSITLADLQTFCRRQGLSPFKLPRALLLEKKAFPRSVSGKLDAAKIKKIIRDAGHMIVRPKL